MIGFPRVEGMFHVDRVKDFLKIGLMAHRQFSH